MTEENQLIGLTIGRLAKLAGFGIEAVRFSECQGLIEPLPCKESSYRMTE